MASSLAAFLATAREAFLPSPGSRASRVALAVLAAGLLLTTLLALRTWDLSQAGAAERFTADAERLEGSVERRIHRVTQILQGAAAADAAAGGFDRASFTAYANNLQAQGDLHPLLGIGWVEPVARADHGAFTARQRAQGEPEFGIQSSGDAAESLLVTFMEPRAVRQGVLGLDMADSPPRREAAGLAIATGKATLTAPVQLKNDPGRPGWLMFLPLYRAGAPVATASERRAALRGLLVAAMTVQDVLSTVRGVQEDQLHFQLRDAGDPDGLVFDSREPAAGNVAPGPDLRTDTLAFAGRLLTVRVWPHQRPHDAGPVAWLVFTGVALSLLLALASANLLRARDRAEQRSSDMQRDLRRMEELAERTSGVLIGLDERLRVRWVNAGFKLLTGWDDSGCIDVPVSRLLRAADGDIELPQLADRLRHGATRVRIELLAERPGGPLRWLDADLQRDPDGFLLTAIDVTARREAERRLAENEHLVQLMMDNIDARLSYWDADLHCRAANLTLARDLGIPRWQLVGRRMPDLMLPDLFAELEPHVRSALAGRPQRFERSRRGADGTTQTSLVHFAPDYDNGHVRGLFCFAMDVTALKQAQDAALRANAAKSRFLSHMSHEIRTPMNGVLGMLALLHGTALDVHQAEYAGKAESAARSLLGLLDDLLDLTKIEAGKMLLDPVPFRPALLLRDVAAILDGPARARSLHLALELEPGVPAVLVADDMRLRQVLVNLGGNALKFTHEGEVRITVRSLGSSGGRARLAFAVRDTGIGIAPADQQAIFEDFSQASAATTREFGGTGLGLGISRRLVAMLGGALLLDSAPGRGSCFHFVLELPVGDDDAVPVLDDGEAGARLRAGNALAGLRLLVVEDNPLNQQVARELLAAQGADVTLAADGAQGVHCVETASPRFDAVLMDVQMPVLDGWGAAREIRTRLGDTTTPIIAMTANAMKEDRERSREAGMDHHVAKPFDLPALVALLRRVTGSRDAAPAPTFAPAPAPAVEAPAWTRGAALQRMAGDEALLDRVLPVFRSNLLGSAAQLDALRGDCAPAEAVKLFHSLKGMAATMGADALAHRSAEAERRIGDGSGKAGELARDVRAALDQVLRALG